MPIDQHRLDRALSQPLYLLDALNENENENENLMFTVFGTTKSVYKVKFSSDKVHKCTCTCTCKDFLFRGKRFFCKHGLFVLCKVLKIDHFDSILENTQLSLEDFNLLKHKFYHVSVTVSVEEEFFDNDDDDDDDPCAICYDTFSDNDNQLTCRCKRCKKKVHHDCMEKWISMANRQNNIPSCVYCRTPWIQEKSQCNSIQDFLNESAHIRI